ncbi:MAG: CDP-glycerol glycerophosphotransferase family protein [Oscillospiraceae bacterium]|nr:CDP-glycerol glycerophosphotransferase family protein [Oscillospiraceae bacterium]
MNPIKSFKGRLDGLRNDFSSHYWEYIQYYCDSTIWDQSVLFESFGGKNFQGNPYYLYREIFSSEAFSGLTLYIAHRNPEGCIRFLEARGLLDERVRVILYGSAEYRNVLSHTKYLINNVSFSMDWIKKSGQVYLNTWHGTPLKCLGRNIRNDPFELNNSQRNMLLADLLLAPNDLTARVFLEDHMIRDIMPGRLVYGGYPRNTAFFDRELRETIRRRFGLNEKQVVFYMPTWRGTAGGVKSMDFTTEMERLAEELGDEYAVFLKLHPAMLQSVGKMRFCHQMPDEYEVYEFLNAADILITDYSSVYFDFTNTGRRTILYQYDRDSYFSDRGVYPDVLKLTPYPVVRTYAELKQRILEGKETADAAFREEFCPKDSPLAARELIAELKKFRPAQPGKPVDLYVISFPVTDEQLLRWKQLLVGQCFRFVFVPRRNNRRFSNLGCFDRIEYLTCWDTARSIGAESLFAREKLILRERKRLWGDLRIGHVYAKSGRLPLPLQMNLEPWPAELYY